MDNIKRLIPYIKPHTKSIVLSVIYMVLSAVLQVVFLFLLRNVLTPILDLKASNRMTHLNFFVLVVFGWAVLRVISDFASSYVTQRTGQRILTELRADLFTHLQTLTVGYFEKQRTGEVMSRLTNDLGALQTVLTVAVIAAVRAPFEMVGYLGVMLYLNWKLSFAVFILLPPIALAISRAGHNIRAASAQLQGQLGELTNYLQEKISAMRLVQTFGTSAHEVNLFNAVNRETYKRTMRPIRIQSTLAPVVDFVAYVGFLVVLYIGALTRMKPADLLAFLVAMRALSMDFKSVASLDNMCKSADAAAARLFEVMDTVPEVADSPNAIDLDSRTVEGGLVFENVRFSYNGTDEVLHGISFEVKPGEVIALAGLSGSGKTTISNLVPRLYDPTGGRVLVDGLDLRDVKLQSLRSRIGSVPQETTLFHGTIRSNIAYGKPHASEAEIEAAARSANAHNFIIEQPDGYDTQIGERGGRLSGGQRQRIAIARALLRDPRILILDEATSSLDAESEALVQEALARLMEGRTTLIIAHRFSTIRHANKILVLADGDVAESGTHEELLQRDGIYSRLYQMQTFVATENEAVASELL